MKVADALGGAVPLTATALAERAYRYTLNPLRNTVKDVLDACPSVEETPPLLGIFNDIPWYQFRESEAVAWARSGFSWVINDGEHTQWEGHYGREQNAVLGRLGMLAVQRLHRGAVSEFGDTFVVGARAAMRPYGMTYDDAARFFASLAYPEPGQATQDDRGGYPVRTGDRSLVFTPEELRAAETETQGWLQFETWEYIVERALRDRLLDLMVQQGRHRAVAFVGPFDAILRAGQGDEINAAVNDLFRAAARLGIHAGRVVGSGSMDDPARIEDAMVEAIEHGARLIAVHPLTSDLTQRGAAAVAEPFFRAAARCGFQ